MKNKIEALEYIEVSNAISSIKITLQGAHIIDFTRKGKSPLLFLSKTARFEEGFPIRGGIPICWPWFGSHPSDDTLPNHGFARTSQWEHLQTQEINANKTKIVLSLKSSPQSLKLWPYDFELILEVFISDILELALISKNTGKQSFHLSQALHTYLNIDSIQNTHVEGLQDKPFYNKLNDTYDNKEKNILKFESEVDRVYQDLEQPLVLKDLKQEIEVQTVGSNTVVVWNPGAFFKEHFADLSDYKTMLCLESANALKDEVMLHPNETHVLKSIISQY